MARHDITLGLACGASRLACGLYAATPVLTGFGWRRVADLAPGDLVLTGDSGLAAVRLIRPDLRPALWSVLVPPGSLGNDTFVTLPPGQPVLIESRLALPFCGEAVALVPATALEGWRGITPHVPPHPEPILQIQLARSGTIFVGPGLRAGVDGTDESPFDLARLVQEPCRPQLPLAAARQLVASLIAEEAGLSLSLSLYQSQAAALRAPNRP